MNYDKRHEWQIVYVWVFFLAECEETWKDDPGANY